MPLFHHTKMTYPRNQMMYFALLPGLILLSAAGVWISLDIAAAAYNSLASSLAKRSGAASHFPSSAEFQVRLADLRRATGLTFTANLADAVRASPRDSRLWIQLGLAQEADGDVENAEASLLRAGTLGRDYDTRWTLANFYFRRANRKQAAEWACAALTIPGVESKIVFSLLANIPAKPECILRGDYNGPENVLRDYLQWLISKPSLDGAGDVAHLLIGKRDPDSTALLLDYCDRLLQAGKIPAATLLWNSLAEAGWVSQKEPPAGTVMDPGFKLADPPHGFAWKIPRVAGVELAPLHPGLQISLSGVQPDKCELLSQWLPAGSAPARFLRFRTVASGLAAGSGVHWRVTTPAGVDLLDTPRLESDADIYDRSPTESNLRFADPSKRGLVQPPLIRIALVYARAPGALPARGWIRLEKIWLSE